MSSLKADLLPPNNPMHPLLAILMSFHASILSSNVPYYRSMIKKVSADNLGVFEMARILTILGWQMTRKNEFQSLNQSCRARFKALKSARIRLTAYRALPNRMQRFDMWDRAVRKS